MSELGILLKNMEERLDARFERIETRLDSMDTKFDRIDTRLNSMDQKIDVLANNALDTNSSIVSINTKLSELDIRTLDMQESIEILVTAQERDSFTLIDHENRIQVLESD
ncbi:hypothetical protein KKH15_02815 [Patescibacteria group bacterium]|nr:hypothetical protein [Patescibacteria group bacterium]MBU1755287.1 hypothetical protein [Patescibacteria group bacterium]